MQNWKCSWCKLMCLSMMLFNCEDYRFFILSSSLVFLSSTLFFLLLFVIELQGTTLFVCTIDDLISLLKSACDQVMNLEFRIEL